MDLHERCRASTTSSSEDVLMSGPIVELAGAVVDTGGLDGMGEIGDGLTGLRVDDAVGGGAKDVAEDAVEKGLDFGLRGDDIVDAGGERRLLERRVARSEARR